MINHDPVRLTHRLAGRFRIRQLRFAAERRLLPPLTLALHLGRLRDQLERMARAPDPLGERVGHRGGGEGDARTCVGQRIG